MTAKNGIVKMNNKPTEQERIDRINSIENIDKEIISLCDVLNSIEGVKTYVSCAGHQPKRRHF